MPIPEPSLTDPTVDLRAWVGEALDPSNREFRQAVHTVLYALQSHPDKAPLIALKGAILLAIRYAFTRATKDIDFSIAGTYDNFDAERFLKELGDDIVRATEALPYGLACRIQSHEVRPNRAGATYQTLSVKIGYAPKTDLRRLRRLEGPQGSPSTIAIDVSFNEPFCEVELLHDEGDLVVPAYALASVVAEKLRAIVQQATRDRYRPQDPLDIFVLLQRPEAQTADFRERVLSALYEKSAARALEMTVGSLSDPEPRRRSARDYLTLADQLPIPLPDFEAVYDAVVAFYASLPWPTASRAGT